MKTLNQIYTLVAEDIETQSDTTDMPTGPNRRKWAKNVATRIKNRLNKDDMFTAENMNFLLRVINILMDKGASETNAKTYIRTLLDIGGHHIVESIYTYIQYSPRIKISDYIGKTIPIDKLLNIVNGAIDKAKFEFYKSSNPDADPKDVIPAYAHDLPITKSELLRLLEIDKGKHIISILFNDVSYNQKHGNILNMDNGKSLIIKTNTSTLLYSSEQNGQACAIALIDGFKKLNEKYNLNIEIYDNLEYYNIKKEWLVNTIAMKFIENKVSKAEVISVITNAFKKLHISNDDRYEKIFNTYIAGIKGYAFDYESFIYHYFIYSFTEYCKVQNAAYMLFYNKNLENMYILDCTNINNIIAFYNKIKLVNPSFAKKANTTAQVFNLKLK
jgi:hypothetical protein